MAKTLAARRGAGVRQLESAQIVCEGADDSREVSFAKWLAAQSLSRRL